MAPKLCRAGDAVDIVAVAGIAGIHQVIAYLLWRDHDRGSGGRLGRLGEQYCDCAALIVRHRDILAAVAVEVANCQGIWRGKKRWIQKVRGKCSITPPQEDCYSTRVTRYCQIGDAVLIEIPMTIPKGSP